MSCGLASTYQVVQLNEPQSELLFFVLPISTPLPPVNESEPICCTTSTV